MELKEAYTEVDQVVKTKSRYPGSGSAYPFNKDGSSRTGKPARSKPCPTLAVFRHNTPKHVLEYTVYTFCTHCHVFEAHATPAAPVLVFECVHNTFCRQIRQGWQIAGNGAQFTLFPLERGTDPTNEHQFRMFRLQCRVGHVCPKNGHRYNVHISKFYTTVRKSQKIGKRYRARERCFKNRNRLRPHR